MERLAALSIPIGFSRTVYARLSLERAPRVCVLKKRAQPWLIAMIADITNTNLNFRFIIITTNRLGKDTSFSAQAFFKDVPRSEVEAVMWNVRDGKKGDGVNL
jgi:hypothetical protein